MKITKKTMYTNYMLRTSKKNSCSKYFLNALNQLLIPGRIIITLFICVSVGILISNYLQSIFGEFIDWIENAIAVIVGMIIIRFIYELTRKYAESCVLILMISLFIYILTPNSFNRMVKTYYSIIGFEKYNQAERQNESLRDLLIPKKKEKPKQLILKRYSIV